MSENSVDRLRDVLEVLRKGPHTREEIENATGIPNGTLSNILLILSSYGVLDPLPKNHVTEGRQYALLAPRDVKLTPREDGGVEVTQVYSDLGGTVRRLVSLGHRVVIESTFPKGGLQSPIQE